MTLVDRLKRIERKLDQIISFQTAELSHMADQATLDALAKAVSDNTNATHAAETALAGFVKTVSDLTAQLQAAVASNDQAAVQAAVDALSANNAALTAAIPATAAAVTANTPAA